MDDTVATVGGSKGLVMHVEVADGIVAPEVEAVGSDGDGLFDDGFRENDVDTHQTIATGHGFQCVDKNTGSTPDLVIPSGGAFTIDINRIGGVVIGGMTGVGKHKDGVGGDIHDRGVGAIGNAITPSKRSTHNGVFLLDSLTGRRLAEHRQSNKGHEQTQ